MRPSDMRSFGVTVPREELTKFCRSNHIRRLAIFGSVIHGDSTPESDLDVLVEFERGHIPGLDFFRMQDELSRLFDRQVDLNTPQFLSPYFRERVLREAEVLYAR
jgi:predicted nucleotidyltransferase